jgi:hypothetical protein
MMHDDFVTRLFRGEAFLSERRIKYRMGAAQMDAAQIDADPSEILQEPGMIS